MPSGTEMSVTVHAGDASQSLKHQQLRPIGAEVAIAGEVQKQVLAVPAAAGTGLVVHVSMTSPLHAKLVARAGGR